MSIYNELYARRYIESTLNSPYTIYKNQQIAQVVRELGGASVADLGCNVSGLIKREGSLRYQLGIHGIEYIGLDISPAYFNRSLPHKLDVPGNETYNDVMGVVGDIRTLPFGDENLECVVSADVIEHIDEPGVALAEMNRVLVPGGHAIIVVPSLYKLDAVNLPHISERRVSSHENRLTTQEWINLCEKAGFVFDVEKSTPLAIASGLSYLTWLNDEFVPQRRELDGVERYPPKAEMFKQAKHIISKYDAQIDRDLSNHPETIAALMQQFANQDLNSIIETLKRLSYQYATEDECEVLQNFFRSFDSAIVDPARLTHLFSMITNSNRHSRDDVFLGNSALLVLKK